MLLRDDAGGVVWGRKAFSGDDLLRQRDELSDEIVHGRDAPAATASGEDSVPIKFAGNGGQRREP